MVYWHALRIQQISASEDVKLSTGLLRLKKYCERDDDEIFFVFHNFVFDFVCASW